MVEALEKGKEYSHSAHANGMHEMNVCFTQSIQVFRYIHCIQKVLRYIIFKNKQFISTVQTRSVY